MGDDLNGNHLGFGVGYGAGPISLSANYGRYNLDNGLDAERLRSVGRLRPGRRRERATSATATATTTGTTPRDDFETVSFGVRMSF